MGPLRKEIFLFFNRILQCIVHPDLRKEMVLFHIQFLLEIITFNNEIDIEKYQEEYVTEIGKHLRDLYELYKK